MLSKELEVVAEEVYRGHLSGGIDPSPALKALDLDDGLRIQLAVLDRLRSAGEELGAWKVGMTSGDAHNRMGEGFRPFGFILKSRIYRSGAAIPLGPKGPIGIEPELGFRVERPLKGRSLTAEEVRSAVSTAIPSFELLASQLRGAASHGATIASDLSNWGLVLAQPGGWRGDIAEVAATLHRDGELVGEAGPRFKIDDPMRSISSLCGTLDRFDLGLEPGQHVITGAFYKSDVNAPGKWVGTFAGVGAVEVAFV